MGTACLPHTPVTYVPEGRRRGNRAIMKQQSATMVTKEFLPFLKTLKNRTTMEART
jgi:hypothetical protein